MFLKSFLNPIHKFEKKSIYKKLFINEGMRKRTTKVGRSLYFLVDRNLYLVFNKSPSKC